jgi:hypothetical protein
MIELDIEHSQCQVPSAKCTAKTRGAIALAAAATVTGGRRQKIQYNTKYNTNTYNTKYTPPSGVFSFPGPKSYLHLRARLGWGLRMGAWARLSPPEAEILRPPARSKSHEPRDTRTPRAHAHAQHATRSTRQKTTKARAKNHQKTSPQTTKKAQRRRKQNGLCSSAAAAPPASASCEQRANIPAK